MAKTVILGCEADKNDTGVVFVLLGKVDFSSTEIKSEPHRFSITPGLDFNFVKSEVNKHLDGMGFPPLANDDWNAIRDVTETVQTPEVIEAFKARMVASQPVQEAPAQ